MENTGPQINLESIEKIIERTFVENGAQNSAKSLYTKGFTEGARWLQLQQIHQEAEDKRRLTLVERVKRIELLMGLSDDLPPEITVEVIHSIRRDKGVGLCEAKDIAIKEYYKRKEMS